jgi:hypothetical protein
MVSGMGLEVLHLNKDLTYPGVANLARIEGG